MNRFFIKYSLIWRFFSGPPFCFIGERIVPESGKEMLVFEGLLE